MIKIPSQRFALAAAFATCIAAPLVAMADDGPLDPKYMTKDHQAYWEKHVAAMDMQGDGRVTPEGFIKYYSDLWDKNVPAGKTEVPYQALADTWASMETQNPLDPQYKTPLWRVKHVESMDVDKDGTVSKEEFLKHMEGHWAQATAMAKSTTLTHQQAMEMITNPLDPRYHKI